MERATANQRRFEITPKTCYNMFFSKEMVSYSLSAFDQILSHVLCIQHIYVIFELILFKPTPKTICIFRKKKTKNKTKKKKKKKKTR